MIDGELMLTEIFLCDACSCPEIEADTARRACAQPGT
jgi:hypothetical protein|eukprot:COSAG01_NODE_1443_length_10286_cov_7.093649_5_plen_37_part_00